jgi:hypothetical protein
MENLIARYGEVVAISAGSTIGGSWAMTQFMHPNDAAVPLSMWVLLGLTGVTTVANIYYFRPQLGIFGMVGSGLAIGALYRHFTIGNK